MYLDQLPTDELRASWAVKTGSHVCGKVPFSFPFPLYVPYATFCWGFDDGSKGVLLVWPKVGEAMIMRF